MKNKFLLFLSKVEWSDAATLMFCFPYAVIIFYTLKGC